MLAKIGCHNPPWGSPLPPRPNRLKSWISDKFDYKTVDLLLFVLVLQTWGTLCLRKFGSYRNVVFQTHLFCMAKNGLAWNTSVKH